MVPTLSVWLIVKRSFITLGKFTQSMRNIQFRLLENRKKFSDSIKISIKMITDKRISFLIIMLYFVFSKIIVKYQYQSHNYNTLLLTTSSSTLLVVRVHLVNHCPTRPEIAALEQGRRRGVCSGWGCGGGAVGALMQVVCVLLLYRGGVGVPEMAGAVVAVQLVPWCRWYVYFSCTGEV